MAPLAVEIWSDVVCPWCSRGRRRLEAAPRRVGVAGAQPAEILVPAFERARQEAA